MRLPTRQDGVENHDSIVIVFGRSFLMAFGD